MNEPSQRAEIQRYVQKAFLAKIMYMNEERERRKGDILAQLSYHGRSRNSSAWMIGEIDIEEECIANLLMRKADLYLDAYERRGLKIGTDVLKDIAHSQMEITAARKSSLIRHAVGGSPNEPATKNGGLWTSSEKGVFCDEEN